MGVLLPLERGNESGKRGGLLSPTRVIQKEARKRWTPVFKDPNQRSGREVIRHTVFCDPRETHAVECDLDH
jgi:hypothetical protein